MYKDISPQISALISELSLREAPMSEFKMSPDPRAVRFPSLTRARVSETADFARGMLARLSPVKAVTHADEIMLMTIKRQMQIMLYDEQYYLYRWELAPYYCMLQSTVAAFGRFDVTSADARAAYIDRLREYADYAEGLRHNVPLQTELGIRVFENELPGMLKNIESFIVQPSQHPAWVGENRLPTADSAFQKEIRLQLERVNTGMQAYHDVLSQTSGRAPARCPGVLAYRDAEAYYASLVDVYTGLPASAEALHAQGLDAVRRIQDSLRQLACRLGVKPDVTSLAQHMQAHTNYHDSSKEDVSRRFQSCLDAVLLKMDGYFLPVSVPPCRALPLDAHLEQYLTFGYFSPPSPQSPEGVYYFNGSALETKTWVTCAALAYHELMPGHHYQLSRMYADSDMPTFLKAHADHAYIEGWAEYAADLCREMDLYTDPGYEYGRLMQELFVKLRIVLDTGLNMLGMGMDEARRMMLDNLTLPPADVETELLRYGADMPGQALSYGLGSEYIAALRHDAGAKLGGAFSLPHFHEAVLQAGPVSLPTLKCHTDYFIERHAPSR